MAFAFIFQAGFLIQFARQEGVRILKTTRLTPDALIKQYQEIDSDPRSWAYYLFHYLPSWAIYSSELKMVAEYKILQRFFFHKHKLPLEFHFEKYVTLMFKVNVSSFFMISNVFPDVLLSALNQTYVSELGEVSPINWGILAVIVGVNYFRIAVIDNSLMNTPCGDPPSHETDDATAAADHSGSGYVLHYKCQDYLLIYAIFVVFFLTVMVTIIHVMASLYLEKVLAHCMTVDSIGIPARGRSHFLESFEKMKEASAQSADEGQSTDQRMRSLVLLQPTIAGHSDDGMSSPLNQLREELQKEEIEEEHAEEAARALPVYIRFGRWVNKLIGCDYGEVHHSDDLAKKIFLFQNKELFFKAVDIALFFQCFYMAIWCTQLLYFAEYSNNGGAFAFFLTLPVVTNFLMLRSTVHKSVLLQTVCQLNHEVLSQVCCEVFRSLPRAV